MGCLVHIQCNQSLEEAAEMMSQKRTKNLLVFNGTKLVGIISSDQVIANCTDKECQKMMNDLSSRSERGAPISSN